MSPTLVHLVYIHGFQGDHTTFQAFPTDLQQHLSSNIPSGSNIRVTSSLYPTYKSVKPISHAARNFLEWLSTQPLGPVILLGHSMGGLLAAEAATSASNNPIPGTKPSRIIGMIAFDTPYLGMHPHVVITGIASLFAKKDADGKDQKTETEMNPHPDVTIVDDDVTDHWETIRQKLDLKISRSHSPSPLPSPLASPGSTSLASMSSMHSRSSSASSFLSAASTSPWFKKAQNFVTQHADDPLVRWARKHQDEPVSASKRWIVERFQFGACMFDPMGLQERYSRLVGWSGGVWINYWTQTLPRVKEKKETIENGPNANEEKGKPVDPSQLREDADVVVKPDTKVDVTSPTVDEQQVSNDLAVLSVTVDPAADPKAQEKALRKAEKEQEKQMKKLQKQKERDMAGPKPGRHFIVLPTGMGKILGGGDNWEKVKIAGVEDEVGAHCGLFIRAQNLDYDALVDRVGQRILGWCDELVK